MSYSTEKGRDLAKLNKLSSIIPDHLNVYIPTVTGLQVKVCDLWTQASLHLFVHLITRLHELHRQVHVVPRKAVVGPQC